jgi:hypothetical protein
MSFSELETDNAMEKLKALDQDLKQWPYVWIGRSYLPERRKQKLKIIAGKGKTHNLVEVQFEDGTKAITSDSFYRRRPTR